jgi:plasmid maintenance system antidote protein VapI
MEIGPMKISEALRRAMFEYHIEGQWLAKESGVASNRISQFINGKSGMTSTNLDKIISALPGDALHFLFTLLEAKKAKA